MIKAASKKRFSLPVLELHPAATQSVTSKQSKPDDALCVKYFPLCCVLLGPFVILILSTTYSSRSRMRVTDCRCSAVICLSLTEDYDHDRTRSLQQCRMLENSILVTQDDILGCQKENAFYTLVTNMFGRARHKVYLFHPIHNQVQRRQKKCHISATASFFLTFKDKNVHKAH